MRYKIIMILCILFLSAFAVIAQDDAPAQSPEPSCDMETYREYLATMQQQVNDAAAQADAESDALAIIQAIYMFADGIRVQCVTRTISAETDPDGIIGPLSFSGTLYEATLSIPDTFGSITMTPLEGDCDLDLTIILTDNEGGEETNLWEPGGDCIAMFEVNSTSDNWTLDFQRLQ